MFVCPNSWGSIKETWSDEARASSLAVRQNSHGDQILKAKTTKGEKYTISGKLKGPSDGYSAHYTVTLDKTGEVIGQADMSRDNDYLSIVGVNSKYQRQGIGSNLYSAIEKHQGRKLKPSPDNVSDKAKGLWNKRRSIKETWSDSARAASALARRSSL